MSSRSLFDDASLSCSFLLPAPCSSPSSLLRSRLASLASSLRLIISSSSVSNRRWTSAALRPRPWRSQPRHTAM
uniref:Uncharacterized protein n=1 Tax=Arundo donax TaxID=35708 RepID=A0A0A9D7F2_ARUDO